MSKIIIYTDGGSRGNPGHSAIGFTIETKDFKKGYCKYIGHGTNNEAEYTAVVLALKKARQVFGKGMEIDLYSDSELLVKQLNGEYKVKKENIQKLFVEIWNQKPEFKILKFTHIRREKNKSADALVNKALDKELTKG